MQARENPRPSANRRFFFKGMIFEVSPQSGILSEVDRRQWSRRQGVRASGEASPGRPVRADNSRRVPPVSVECVCLCHGWIDWSGARLGASTERLSGSQPGRRWMRQTPATSRAALNARELCGLRHSQPVNDSGSQVQFSDAGLPHPDKSNEAAPTSLAGNRQKKPARSQNLWARQAPHLMQISCAHHGDSFVRCGTSAREASDQCRRTPGT
jgi:hypothetical protein